MPASGPIPAAEALARAATEAEQVAALGRALQEALGPLLASDAGAATAARAGEWQALDLLSQQADGLGAFLRGLGRDAAPGCVLDAGAAAAALPLADQRDRLGGGGDAPAFAFAGEAELW